jgi:hypothetical protein
MFSIFSDGLWCAERQSCCIPNRNLHFLQVRCSDAADPTAHFTANDKTDIRANRSTHRTHSKSNSSWGDERIKSDEQTYDLRRNLVANVRAVNWTYGCWRNQVADSKAFE